MIDLNEKNAEAWAWKGDILLSLHKFTEAAACFDKAIELAPDWKFPREAMSFAQKQLAQGENSADLLRAL